MSEIALYRALWYPKGSGKNKKRAYRPGVKGEELLPDAPAHPTRATKRAHRLVLIGAPVLCSALLLGGYAWHEYQLAEHEHQLVAETAARLREILISEQGLTESVMGPPANMTYDEFFRACDRSLDERNRLVVAVRVLPQNASRLLRERIISHFKAMNELVRAKANLMHLVVRWQSKSKNHSNDLSRLEAEFFLTHMGGEREAVEWAYKRAIAEVDALANEMSESANEFDALYDKAVDEEEAVSVEARQAGITFESGLRKFATANKALSARARIDAK
jgi:hypothetical protein